MKEDKKRAEIARLARAIRKATGSVADMFKTLERPSVKLTIEIEKFYRESCEKRVLHAVIEGTRESCAR